MKRTGNTFCDLDHMLAGGAWRGIGLAALCCTVLVVSVPACEDERIAEDCCDGVDNDGDQLADLRDMDCATAVCPEPDGGSDGDAGTDADEDADIAPQCLRDYSDQVLRTRCEIGDCTASGRDTECCVAADTICRTVITVGDLYSDLEIDYRGFYSEEHECALTLIESAGEMQMMFVIQTRGLACEYGFMRVQLRAPVDEIAVGQTYELCDDPTAPNLRLVVTTNSDTGGSGEQMSFHNMICSDTGVFEVSALGDESGEEYTLRFHGTLTGLDNSSRPTGERLEIDVESDGLIEVVRE
jgi:hypothetical protein